MLNVQAPPRPNYQYIGMIARRRSNNDTAYLQEPNKPTPFGMRLNDLDPSQRFRMVSISAYEVILEDASLGFRHKIPLVRPSGGGGGGRTTDGRGGFGDRNTPGRFSNEGTTTIVPYNPTLPQTQEIPGIPNNIPRYVPPTPQQTKKEVDEDDEDGDN